MQQRVYELVQRTWIEQCKQSNHVLKMAHNAIFFIELEYVIILYDHFSLVTICQNFLLFMITVHVWCYYNPFVVALKNVLQECPTKGVKTAINAKL